MRLSVRLTRLYYSLFFISAVKSQKSGILGFNCREKKLVFHVFVRKFKLKNAYYAWQKKANCWVTIFFDPLLGKFNVTKMPGTIVHITGTRLTSRKPIDYTLSRIHNTLQFGFSIFIWLGKDNASLGYTHTFDFIGRQNTELNTADKSL